MAIEGAIFRRSELLLGDEAMERIAQKRVIIFGVGGVGSWCAESLVRSGIRRLTIVDSDRVCITNVNRQLMATMNTVGQVKVDALKERLLTINPSAEITALQQIFTEETAGDFHFQDYDYIIDAIDSLKDKAALILLATSFPATGEVRKAPKLFSSMGAALKLDPTRIQITEFWKVSASSSASIPTNYFSQRAREKVPSYISPPSSALCWQAWSFRMQQPRSNFPFIYRRNVGVEAAHSRAGINGLNAQMQPSYPRSVCETQVW